MTQPGKICGEEITVSAVFCILGHKYKAPVTCCCGVNQARKKRKAELKYVTEKFFVNFSFLHSSFGQRKYRSVPNLSSDKPIKNKLKPRIKV